MKIEIIKTDDGKTLVYIGEELKQIHDEYSIKHFLIEQIKKCDIVRQ
jgi:hypothetical protein